MRHTIADLKQMQSLPLDAKVQMTKARVRAWYEHFDGQVYVSFSGGKDSTVLKHVVDSMYDDVPSVFVNTGLEYPEVRRFALSFPGVVRIDPAMKFYEIVERYGYPVVSKAVSDTVAGARVSLEKDPTADTFRVRKLRGELLRANGTPSEFNCKRWAFLLDAPFRTTAKCCDILKKNPLKKYQRETGRAPIVGTMADESRMRYKNWLLHGCNAFAARAPVSSPLSFWTEQDVLRYIVENGLEIASVYGEIRADGGGRLYLTGEERTGCMFCMFGAHLEKAPNRFQRMKKTHPRQWDYCMTDLGLKQVLDYLGVESE